MESRDWVAACVAVTPVRRAIDIQNGSHKNPVTPITAKHACHDQVWAIQTNSPGPMILAKLVPKLTIPITIARWEGGKYSAVALLTAGKFGASPKPSSMRK